MDSLRTIWHKSSWHDADSAELGPTLRVMGYMALAFAFIILCSWYVYA